MRQLSDLLKKGEVGRASVGKGSAQVTVYVRKGALVAATSSDDARLLLRRLGVRGALSARRSAELQAMDDMGEPILGFLLDEIPHADLDGLLAERFEDNLVRFAATEGKANFKAQPLGPLFNVQLVSDTQPLLDRVSRRAAAAARLPTDATLATGNTRPKEHFAKVARARLISGETANDLLARLDVDPWLGRAALSELVDSGVLQMRGADAPLKVTGQIIVEDEPEDLPSDAIDLEVLPEVPDLHAATGDVLDVAELTEALEELEEPDPHTEEAEESAPATEGLRGLTSLSAWMESSHEVEDDELDAFADNEQDRSAGANSGDGGFKVEEHNLDKVDVAAGSASEPDEEPEDALEADEAANSYSAPTLSEEDAAAKVEYVNDKLRIMAAAMDGVEGPGAGRAALQLLIEGSPAKFKALFNGLQLTDSGELPGDDLLDNLYTRPATEHRALVSEALIDLIERALSAVGDELPDEDFDRMYEAVAGYRQKLVV